MAGGDRDGGVRVQSERPALPVGFVISQGQVGEPGAGAGARQPDSQGATPVGSPVVDQTQGLQGQGIGEILHVERAPGYRVTVAQGQARHPHRTGGGGQVENADPAFAADLDVRALAIDLQSLVDHQGAAVGDANGVGPAAVQARLEAHRIAVHGAFQDHPQAVRLAAIGAGVHGPGGVIGGAGLEVPRRAGFGHLVVAGLLRHHGDGAGAVHGEGIAGHGGRAAVDAEGHRQPLIAAGSERHLDRRARVILVGDGVEGQCLALLGDGQGAADAGGLVVVVAGLGHGQFGTARAHRRHVAGAVHGGHRRGGAGVAQRQAGVHAGAQVEARITHGERGRHREGNGLGGFFHHQGAGHVRGRLVVVVAGLAGGERGAAGADDGGGAAADGDHARGIAGVAHRQPGGGAAAQGEGRVAHGARGRRREGKGLAGLGDGQGDVGAAGVVAVVGFHVNRVVAGVGGRGGAAVIGYRHRHAGGGRGHGHRLGAAVIDPIGAGNGERHRTRLHGHATADRGGGVVIAVARLAGGERDAAGADDGGGGTAHGDHVAVGAGEAGRQAGVAGGAEGEGAVAEGDRGRRRERESLVRLGDRVAGAGGTALVVIVVTGVTGPERITANAVSVRNAVHRGAAAEGGGTQIVPAGAVGAFEADVAGGAAGAHGGDQVDGLPVGAGAAGGQGGGGGHQNLGGVRGAGAVRVTTAAHHGLVGEAGGGVAGHVHGQGHRRIAGAGGEDVVTGAAHRGQIAVPAGATQGGGGQAGGQGVGQGHGAAQGCPRALVAHGQGVGGAGLALVEIAGVRLGQGQLRRRDHPELEALLALLAFLDTAVVVVAGGGQGHGGGAVLPRRRGQRQGAGVATATQPQAGRGQQGAVVGAHAQGQQGSLVGVAHIEIQVPGGRALQQAEDLVISDQAERGMGLVGADVRGRQRGGRGRREGAPPAALVGGEISAGQAGIAGVQGRAAVGQGHGAGEAVVVGQVGQARFGHAHLVALNAVRQATGAAGAHQVVGAVAIQAAAHVAGIVVAQTVARHQGVVEGHRGVAVGHVQAAALAVAVTVGVGGVAGGGDVHQAQARGPGRRGQIQAAAVGGGAVAGESAVDEPCLAVQVGDHQTAAGAVGGLVVGQGAADDLRPGTDQIQAGAAGAAGPVAVDGDPVQSHGAGVAHRHGAAVPYRGAVMLHPVVAESGALHAYLGAVEGRHGATGAGRIVDHVIGEQGVVEGQRAGAVAGGILAAVPVQGATVAVAVVVAVAQPQGGEAGVEGVAVRGIDAEQLAIGRLPGAGARLQDGGGRVRVLVTAAAHQRHGALDHQGGAEGVGTRRDGDGHQRLAAFGNGVGLGDRLPQCADAATLAITTGAVFSAVHRQGQGLGQGGEPQQAGGKQRTSQSPGGPAARSGSFIVCHIVPQ